MIGVKNLEVAACVEESRYLSVKKAGIILVRADMASVAAGAPSQVCVLQTLKLAAHICS